MATNDIGRVTPIWRGFYSAATTYELNDIVIDTAGSVWWHKSEELTTGVVPAAGEIWDAVIDMSIFSGLIQAAITTAQTALAAAQAALAEVTADAERAETAADNAENSAAAASESAAGVGALAQAAAASAEAAAGSATGAAGSAQAAAGSKSDAEAYAVGTRGGEDVGSTDPTYHNNAKYYAEQAASEAEAAAQSAEDAQDVLDSIPEDYSQLSADVGDLKTQISSDAYLGNLYYYGDTAYGQTLSSGGNGATSSSETSNTTDYIDVSNIKLIYGNVTTGGRYWFYKADKTPIDETTKTGKIPSGQELIPGSGVHFVTVPSSAVYFRVSFPKDAPSSLYVTGTNMYELFLEEKIQDMYQFRNQITDFNTATELGIYSFGALSSVQHRPENFGHVSGQLYVMESSSYSYQYAVRSSDGSVWMRIYKKSDETFGEWLWTVRSDHNVTACIIGASIEAGTTHETPTSGAVKNPEKAYLTVALRANGVTVTNLSHGGMGYIRKASDNTLFKDIIDNTDFSAFESVYITLGSNDWNYNVALGEPANTTAYDTVCGRLKYAIEKIYTDNPKIKLFVLTPNIRATRGDFSTLWGWNAENEASTPYTLKDVNDAIVAVCAQYGVECWSGYQTGIVNAYNILDAYPDGTHPSQATMAQMAKNMTGRITFK